MPFTWFSPNVEKIVSNIEGTGLIARQAIRAGEVAVVKGGHIFDRTRRDALAETMGPAEIQIGDDLFIGPEKLEEREAVMMYLNHSCEPNLGIQGQISFHAMRDIEAGEELTFDYATGDDDDWSMECACGAKTCRGTVTGQDWRIAELQEKYRGWFSHYLERKIAKSGR